MATRSLLLISLVSFVVRYPVVADQQDEEACQRLQTALGSLLHGSEEQRLALAESAEDAFDDLDDDACSRSVMKAVDRFIEREEDAFLVFRFLPGWAEVDDRVAPLLLALERDEPDVRLAAIQALVDSGSDVEASDISRLLKAFRRETDPRVRLLVIEVFGEVGGAATEAELLSIANAKNGDEAAAAIDVLPDLEEPGVVLEAWRRHDAKVREAALSWMTEHLDAPGVLELVIDVSTGRPPEAAPLRALAASALFEVDDPRAPEAWLSFVLDPEVPLDDRVRIVSQSTGDIAWRRALEEIVRRATAAEEPLRTAARLRLQDMEMVSTHCAFAVNEAVVAGKILPAAGELSVPCLTRPDYLGAARGDPLAEGTEVVASLTWSEGGRRWFGVGTYDDAGDRLCWIEEQRLSPAQPEN